MKTIVPKQLNLTDIG